jgi:hypothetical protein
VKNIMRLSSILGIAEGWLVDEESG